MYINLNISKVKKHRVWERYDSVLCNLCDLSILKGTVVDYTIEEVG